MRTARPGSSGPAVRAVWQVAAFDQPHVHIETAINFAVVMDRNDVGAIETRRRTRFAAEPLLKHLVVGQVLRKDFHRDDAVGGGVKGAPYLTHPAAAQQFDEPITPERRPLRITVHLLTLLTGWNNLVTPTLETPRLNPHVIPHQRRRT